MMNETEPVRSTSSIQEILGVTKIILLY